MNATFFIGQYILFEMMVMVTQIEIIHRNDFGSPFLALGEKIPWKDWYALIEEGVAARCLLVGLLSSIAC